jgi:hypothetical protein
MPDREPFQDAAQEVASQNEGTVSRARPLRKPPSFRNIVQNYSGTNAEWLLARILGWHDRITPEREKDIDAILYLLEKIGYIPEDPETAAFIALIALVWARMPLAPDLSDNPQHLMTPAAIGDEFKKVAAQMEWIGRKEFQQIDRQLDKFMDNVLDPTLEKFQHSLDIMAQKVNNLLNAKSAEQPDAREIAGQIAEMVKVTSAAPVDTGKISEEITKGVIDTVRNHLKSISLGIVGGAFVVGLLVGAWTFSVGFARGNSPAIQQMVPRAVK